jgi:hypothetical protein
MLMMHTGRDGDGGATGWSPEDLQRMIAYQHALDAEVTEAGEMVVNEGLAWPDEARIVRADDGGAPVVTDGPFPDDREFLIGFWIVDCERPERAYEIAAKASACPGPGGAPLQIPIEVRPIAGPPVTEA